VKVEDVIHNKLSPSSS